MEYLIIFLLLLTITLLALIGYSFATLIKGDYPRINKIIYGLMNIFSAFMILQFALRLVLCYIKLNYPI